MKEQYKGVELEIILFDNADIITTSDDMPEVNPGGGNNN